MDCVNIDYRVNLLQRAVLPVFDLWKKLVRHIRNETLRSLEPIDIHQRVGYLAGGHAFCIHGDDLLVDTGDILLPLFYYLWLKRRLPVLGHLDVHAPEAAVDSLGLVAVAVIVGIRTFRFFITEVVIHLSLHHLFQGTSQKVFQGLLDVLSSLDVILLQQLMDNVPFALRHNYLVYRLLFSSRHNNRPPYDNRFYHRRPTA